MKLNGTEINDEDVSAALDSILGGSGNLNEQELKTARDKLLELIERAENNRAKTKPKKISKKKSSDVELFKKVKFLNKAGKVERAKHIEEWLQQARKLELKILKLEPAEAFVYSYENPKHMLYNILLAASEQINIDGLVENCFARVGVRYQIQSRSQNAKWLTGAIPRFAFNFVKFSAIALWESLIYKYYLNELSDFIMGQYDALGEMKMSVGRIRLAQSNIRRYAKMMDIDVFDLERQTALHEDIHNTVLAHFDITLAQKETLEELFMGFLGDSGMRSDANEAVMIAVEGYSEFFTNLLAAELLPGRVFIFPKPPLLQRIKSRFLGISRHEERYIKGEKFIAYLYDKGGAEMANMALQFMPESLEEIENPELYLANLEAAKQDGTLSDEDS